MCIHAWGACSSMPCTYLREEDARLRVALRRCVVQEGALGAAAGGSVGRGARVEQQRGFHPSVVCHGHLQRRLSAKAEQRAVGAAVDALPGGDAVDGARVGRREERLQQVLSTEDVPAGAGCEGLQRVALEALSKEPHLLRGWQAAVGVARERAHTRPPLSRTRTRPRAPRRRRWPPR